MMSLETIHALSRTQAARAARDGQEPYMVWADDLKQWRYDLAQGTIPRLPFPNLGDYRPAGWKLVETMLVDKSGMGAEWEPALTARQLIERRLEPDHGYAIVEEGQFQVVVGEFERDPEATGNDAEVGDLVLCGYCESEQLLAEDGSCDWCGEEPNGNWVDGEYVEAGS